MGQPKFIQRKPNRSSDARSFSAAVLIPGKVRTISYRNIVCFFCNVRDIIPTHEGNKLDCLFTYLFKGKDPVMTGLLNYRPGRVMGDETKAVTYGDAREHCSCQSIFDKDKVVFSARYIVF